MQKMLAHVPPLHTPDMHDEFDPQKRPEGKTGSSVSVLVALVVVTVDPVYVVVVIVAVLVVVTIVVVGGAFEMHLPFVLL